VAVPPEHVGNRVLGEAQAVVHAKAVGRLALRVVEVDLLGDPREQSAQPVGEVAPRFRDSLPLGRLQGVSRWLGYGAPAR
jgi:hypothetical protein